MALTINESLYVGRAFDPIIEFARGPEAGTRTYETKGNPNGTNELACISFVAPTTVGSVVNVSANINPDAGWDEFHPFGMACILSIGERGDFSSNAVAGLMGASIQGVVGKTGRGLLTLEPGGSYYINVAPKKPNAKPGMRINVSFTVK